MPLICPECESANVQPVGEKQYCCQDCGVLLGQYLLPGNTLYHCPKCRAIVLPDAAFCHQCGAELTVLQSLLALKPCPACGRLIPISGSYCSYCRASIVPVHAQDSMTDEGAGRSRESVGCPACGRTIGRTAAVCRYCGVNVQEFIASVRQAGLNNLETFDQRFDQERQQRLKAARESFVSQDPMTLMGIVFAIVMLFINWGLSKLIVDSLVMVEGAQELLYVGLFALLVLGELGLLVAWLRAKTLSR
jgi:hypothetical protein